MARSHPIVESLAPAQCGLVPFSQSKQLRCVLVCGRVCVLGGTLGRRKEREREGKREGKEKEREREGEGEGRREGGKEERERGDGGETRTGQNRTGQDRTGQDRTGGLPGLTARLPSTPMMRAKVQATAETTCRRAKCPNREIDTRKHLHFPFRLLERMFGVCLRRFAVASAAARVHTTAAVRYASSVSGQPVSE